MRKDADETVAAAAKMLNRHSRIFASAIAPVSYPRYNAEGFNGGEDGGAMF
jgi:hypothetical protein